LQSGEVVEWTVVERRERERERERERREEMNMRQRARTSERAGCGGRFFLKRNLHSSLSMMLSAR